VSELTPITTDTPWLRLKVGPDDLAGEDPALLARLLEQLLLIRAFEEKILELHGIGLIHGPAHASIGQEAGAVGAMSVLRTIDKINGTHRAHHQILAKLLNAAAPDGYDPRRQPISDEMAIMVRRSMAEIMGWPPFWTAPGGSVGSNEPGVVGRPEEPPARMIFPEGVRASGRLPPRVGDRAEENSMVAKSPLNSLTELNPLPLVSRGFLSKGLPEPLI